MKKVEIKLNKVYDYISEYTKENNYPPSVREICSALSISSTATVFSYLEKLEQDGRITRNINKNRAITINKNLTSQYINVPLVGNVSAGTGILAVENIEGYYPLPNSIYKGNLFMLRVCGNSMIEVGISDGDYVVIREQSQAENNQIVLAMFEDDATIKRLIITTDRILLHPENSTMSDLIFPISAPPSILGVVIGCLKKF